MLFHRLRRALALSLLLTVPVAARVRTGPLFGPGCVLQRERPIPVWGQGKDGESVTVSLNGKSAQTIVKDGRWMVRLPAMSAGGPYTLSVQGENRLDYNDVLLGDVFLCGGQSNMEFPLRMVNDGPEASRAAADSQLRLFRVDRRIADLPLPEVGSVQGWQHASPASTINFSAVGYFFGRSLRQSQKVPIGLIMSCWGGTIAESWTSREALAANPELEPLLDIYPAATLRFQSTAYTGKGEWDPAGDPNVASHLFNGMIAGLTPYALRGVIWYQGESNAGRAHQYRTLFPALIEDWRQRFESQLPFMFVQLAPWSQPHTPAEGESWAALREAQRRTAQHTPKTAMVVITDHGSASIHPLDKQPVGERLALAARHLVYGQNVEYSGPLFEDLELHGSRVRVRFSHVGQGLKGQVLTDFELAGADGKFYPAHGRLVGRDTIELTSAQVSAPAAARYGWSLNPKIDLFNSEGLPASPFTSEKG
jgi:sialate O-acetylesterase